MSVDLIRGFTVDYIGRKHVVNPVHIGISTRKFIHYATERNRTEPKIFYRIFQYWYKRHRMAKQCVSYASLVNRQRNQEKLFKQSFRFKREGRKRKCIRKYLKEKMRKVDLFWLNDLNLNLHLRYSSGEPTYFVSTFL